MRLQLQQIDANVFFDGSAGNEQNINHFYWDLDMYANSSVGSPVPIAFMFEWYSGPDGSRSNIAQKENDWQNPDFYRYHSDEYNALYEELLAVTDIEAATALLIQMNDIIISDVVLIPLVNRAGGNYAIANTLNQENIAAGPSFEPDYWNIANWNRVAP